MMAVRSTPIVQSFVIERKWLVPSDRQVAQTETGALMRAEAMPTRIPGTAAIRILADDETDELKSATILGQFGHVPDDFAESLQGS